MKLIFAIVRDTDDGAVINALVSNEFRVTRMASTGGFLRRGMVTLMIGTDENKVKPALELIKQSCQPPEEGQHRATVFVVNAAHYEQI